jgi:hypothetical protein
MNKKQIFQGVCIAGLVGVVVTIGSNILFPPKTVSKYANHNSVAKADPKQSTGSQAKELPVNGTVTTTVEGNKQIETTTYVSVVSAPEQVEISSAPFLTQDYADNLKTIQATYQKRLDLDQKNIDLKLSQLEQESNEISQSIEKKSTPVIYTDTMMPDVYKGSMPKNLSNVNDIIKAPSAEDITDAFSDLSVGSISSSDRGIEVWLSYNGGYVDATAGTSFGPYTVTSVTLDSVVIYNNELHVSKTIGNSIRTVSARVSSTTSGATSSSKEMKLPPVIDNKR